MYHPHLQDNIDNVIAKKVEYYAMKEKLLQPFAPTVIHKQFVKNTKRVYSYEEDYQKNLVEKEADIFGTSFDILKGCDDGLERIVSVLREHELTKKEEGKIVQLIQNYFSGKRL